MTKGERAIKSLREAADALDALPYRRTSLLGIIVSSESLRSAATWIENQMVMWAQINEEIEGE